VRKEREREREIMCFRSNSKVKLLAIFAKIRSSITCRTQMVHHLWDCHVFLCNVIDKSILELHSWLSCSTFGGLYRSVVSSASSLGIIQLGFTLQQHTKNMFFLNTHNVQFTFLASLCKFYFISSSSISCFF
jgi:hypothetical protein